MRREDCPEGCSAHSGVANALQNLAKDVQEVKAALEKERTAREERDTDHATQLAVLQARLLWFPAAGAGAGGTLGAVLSIIAYLVWQSIKAGGG